MKEPEIKLVAAWMKRVSDEISDFEYAPTKEERIAMKKKFKEFIKKSEELKTIRAEVNELCARFPIYK